LGEERADSDVDLLVVHRRGDPFVVGGLALRLGRAVDRPVHVVQLQDADQSPSLLADVVTEGRVLVDRDGLWDALVAGEDELLAAAEREEAEALARAHKAADEARARLVG
jgi:predicted nucleotidyltransferase